MLYLKEVVNVILSHLILNLYHYGIYKLHLVDACLRCVCLYMGIHMCVATYICQCASMHVMCMWRPENWHLLSSLIVFHIMYGGRISHLNPEFTSLPNLASQLALWIPCLHLLTVGITGEPHHLPNVWVRGLELWFSCLHVKHFTYQLSYFPGLVFLGIFLLIF